jgi:hypothetical protein
LQAELHFPALHEAVPWAGAPHFLVQLEQWFGSLERSTHEPLQLVSAPQFSAHWPSAHTRSLGHAFVHDPQ